MTFSQIFIMALSNLQNNKFKTFLVIFSMVISISACIIILTFGSSAYPLIINEFSKFGAKKVIIQPYQDEARMERKSAISMVLPIEKVQIIKNALTPFFDGITYSASKTEKLLINGKVIDFTVMYTDSDYFKVNNIKLLNGLMFRDFDFEIKQPVCIIENHDLIPLYMKHQNYIGNFINIGGKNYKIIGMVKSLSPDKENTPTIYLPIYEYIPKIQYVSNLQLNVKDIYTIEQSVFIANQVLLRHNDFNKSFEADYMKSFLRTIYKIIANLKIIVLIASGISFFVGGTGISNIMTLSIKDRTKEIGILKAIGAENKVILKQFLIESMIIGLIGGCFGVLIGILIPFSISLILDLAFSVSILSVFFSFVLSLLIGIIFGFIPAYRASKLNPIDTLRYD
ncbi:MAG: hypothetical protein A2Y40_01195 [Candidatus Margulisbacteria bacterium GWF2_35_9]|nr:MAG: hypothetical protein A2Y40_01195 [Candidatus Margulisbacteria bacterium GWF2_35_9]